MGLNKIQDCLFNNPAYQSRYLAIGLLNNSAIIDYVGREEKREIFKQEALRTWDIQENGLHLTLEEADAWLAKLEAGEDTELPKCHA